jgi:hypothetical protein
MDMLAAMRASGVPLLLLLGVSCTHVVQSSAILTAPELAPSPAEVQISATRDPAQGREIGVAEAHGRLGEVRLDEVIAEFRARVASMGGDYARIDSLATRHEMVKESYSYECGATETTTETRMVMQLNPDGSVVPTTETVQVQNYVSKTCIGEREVEVFTLAVVGRAFRTAGEMR